LIRKSFQSLWNRVTALSQIQRLGFTLLTLALVISFIGYMIQHGGWQLGDVIHNLIVDYYANVSAELIGIALTVLIIDAIYERRHNANERQDLTLQMGSPDHAFALEAVRLLRLRGWLTDGSLNEVQLAEANLRRANLAGACMRGANLEGANLMDADLTGADLRQVILDNALIDGADLSQVDLRDASLRNAKLRGVELDDANLLGADLTDADLSGDKPHWTDLTRAKITGQQLASARSLEGVTLPDGTRRD
jgi:hypothetical protein